MSAVASLRAEKRRRRRGRKEFTQNAARVDDEDVLGVRGLGSFVVVVPIGPANPVELVSCFLRVRVSSATFDEERGRLLTRDPRLVPSLFTFEVEDPLIEELLPAAFDVVSEI